MQGISSQYTQAIWAQWQSNLQTLLSHAAGHFCMCLFPTASRGEQRHREIFSFIFLEILCSRYRDYFWEKKKPDQTKISACFWRQDKLNLKRLGTDWYAQQKRIGASSYTKHHIFCTTPLYPGKLFLLLQHQQAHQELLILLHWAAMHLLHMHMCVIRHM